MRKVENLTENKGLINTFKKLKTRNYQSKSFFKKRDFFFLKFKQFNFSFFFKKISKNKYIYVNFKKTFNKTDLIFIFNNNRKTDILKTTLMFIKLYF